ncbi:hypothetical protein ACFSGX_01865 [Sphingomonas arantia]|uniref:Uncharacterized protein n=1 Tax=Sphingomonas arantia TaxID=1460676 RepID=A0ABW4TUY8_9SPHN
MARRDNEYWQVLRKDKRSNIAASLGLIAALFSTMSVVGTAVPGPLPEARGNPLYWLLMLPMVYWVTELTSFTPRSVRMWTPALVVACVASAVAAVVVARDEPGWTVQGGLCVVTVLASIASRWLYRGSLLDREGPAR